MSWQTTKMVNTNNVGKHMLMTADGAPTLWSWPSTTPNGLFPPNNPYRYRSRILCMQKTNHRYGWKSTYITCWHQLVRVEEATMYLYAKQTDGKASGIPGGVPQQRRRSSTCSTSNPMNQDPRDTSSLAYLCRTCLKCPHPIIMVNGLHLLYL